ncbi:hypothetical protein F511_20098 [Dorcoceras hygrometricum]|uniref:Uncharacterized protein n=1 Tax=Dorcoceras hygrometricum TaxID=472368 RepID=A0A2Z7CEC4_9LAMI|nr:hypothetical protein F511_20098 [Dorcoceras hygrometricum]
MRKRHVLVTVTHMGTSSKSSLCICWFIDMSTGFDDREFLIHLLVCIVDWILVATEYYTNEIKLRLLVVRLSSISRETFLIPQRTVDTLYLLIEEAGFEAEEGISGEQPRVARGNYLDDGSAAGRITTS